MRCPRCKHKLVVGAKFCHRCGAELPPELTEKTAQWYHDPVLVLLAIFLFLGIFGLPLLWNNPRFSGWQKIVISVTTVIYTAIILWVLYYLIVVYILPVYNQLKGFT